MDVAFAFLFQYRVSMDMLLTTGRKTTRTEMLLLRHLPELVAMNLGTPIVHHTKETPFSVQYEVEFRGETITFRRVVIGS